MSYLNQMLIPFPISIGSAIVFTFGVVVLFLSFPVHPAEAASMTFTSDTTIAPNQTIDTGETWTVNPSVTLTIGNNVKVINNGSIVNNGTINISGTGEIKNNGEIHNLPVLDEDGGYLSKIVNSGTIENNGNINNTSLIRNFGIINNQGTIIIVEDGFVLFGAFNNIGTISNFGTIDITSAGMFNQGQINNFGTLNQFPSDGYDFRNIGFIDNQGAINIYHELISYGKITGNPINDNNIFCRLKVETGTIPVPLGNQINATVQQLHPYADKITFRWLDADWNTRREVVDTSPPFEDHFSPDTPGVWTVFALCSNTLTGIDFQTVQQPILVTMNVIPESPVGTLALIASSMAALALYGIRGFQKRKQGQ